MESTDNIKKYKIATSKLDLSNLIPMSKNSSGNTVILSNNINLQNAITKSNTTYCIVANYNLGNNTLTLPEGSSLEFRGGSISNGTIVGKNSSIIADDKVFYKTNLEGTWRCVGNVGWWAEGSSTILWEGSNVPLTKDNGADIQKALDSSFRELVFPPKLYYTGTTLVLRKEKKLVLQGSDMKLSLIECKDSIHNSAVIFTDKDIDLFIIAVTENNDRPATVTIEGGSFDVSRCIDKETQLFIPYTHSCIKVKTNSGEKMWGININTQIKAAPTNTTGIGIDLCPDIDKRAESVELGHLKYNLDMFGYATQVRINGTISNFATGISAKNYMNTVVVNGKDPNTLYYNWCTDVQTDCTIINCIEAIYSNTDIDIRGMIQAGHFYPGNENNGKALINLDSTRASVGANIYDIALGDTTQYALNVMHPSAIIVSYGAFRSVEKAGPAQVGKIAITGYRNRVTN